MMAVDFGRGMACEALLLSLGTLPFGEMPSEYLEAENALRSLRYKKFLKELLVALALRSLKLGAEAVLTGAFLGTLRAIPFQTKAYIMTFPDAYLIMQEPVRKDPSKKPSVPALTKLITLVDRFIPGMLRSYKWVGGGADWVGNAYLLGLMRGIAPGISHIIVSMAFFYAKSFILRMRVKLAHDRLVSQGLHGTIAEREELHRRHADSNRALALHSAQEMDTLYGALAALTLGMLAGAYIGSGFSAAGKLSFYKTADSWVNRLVRHVSWSFAHVIFS